MDKQQYGPSRQPAHQPQPALRSASLLPFALVVVSWLLLGLCLALLAPAPAASAAAGPPAISAPAAIAVDVTSGRILFSKDIHRRLAMASTTKIMTALTALNIEGTNLADTYRVEKEDLIGETSMGLRTGEVVTFQDLLYGMLLNSGNDAAMATARYAGAKLPGSGDPVARFMARMNQQAAAYGMRNSHYVNPHGFDDPNHYTSAYDLAISGWYALKNPVLAKIVATKSATMAGHNLTNANYLLSRYAGATGIKPGFDYEAGLCLVGSATRENQSVIVVVLGEDTRGYQNEPAALLDYAFDQLKQPDIQKAIQQGPSAATASDYIGKPANNRLMAATGEDPASNVNIVNIPSQRGGVLNAQISQIQTTPDATITPGTTGGSGAAVDSKEEKKSSGPNLFALIFVLLVIVGLVYIVLRFTSLGGAGGREFAYKMEDFASRAWELVRSVVVKAWHFIRPGSSEDEPAGAAPERRKSNRLPKETPPVRTPTLNAPGGNKREPARPYPGETSARPAGPVAPPPTTYPAAEVTRPRPASGTGSSIPVNNLNNQEAKVANPLDNFFDELPENPAWPAGKALDNRKTPVEEPAPPPRPLTSHPVSEGVARPVPEPPARPQTNPSRPSETGRTDPAGTSQAANPAYQRPSKTPPPATRPVSGSNSSSDSLGARARQAVDYAFAGRFGPSSEAFRRVIEQDPMFDFGTIDEFEEMPVVGFKALATAYREIGRLKFAILLLDMAIEKYPNDLELRNMQRVLRREAGM